MTQMKTGIWSLIYENILTFVHDLSLKIISSGVLTNLWDVPCDFPLNDASTNRCESGIAVGSRRWKW